MRRYGSSLLPFFFLLSLAAASGLPAQEELVRVSIQPDNTQWDWQPYAEKVAQRFAALIESRVREGIPRREFWTDTTSATLSFLFRIDNSGHLKRFVELTPEYRYLAYLIQRTAQRISPFDSLPENFPYFYFDGTITFHCDFLPAGRYKRLYFEEPLDTLEKIEFTPMYKSKSRTPLFLYEPLEMDKNELFENYKKRIGLIEEIKDTSSYAPLDFSNRHVAVVIPYDSLTGDTYGSEWLKTRIESALEEAGAHISAQEYKAPVPVPPEEGKAPGDSTQKTSESDTVSAKSSYPGEPMDTVKNQFEGSKSEADTTSVESASPEKPKDTTKEPLEIKRSEADTASVESAPPKEPKDTEKEVLKRDLREAFSKVSEKDFLVFSAGIAAGPSPDSAICRLRLFKSNRPDDLKRRLDYKFAHSGYLPDSLGQLLVKRLTNPPAKPAPPPPPKKPAAAVKADSIKAGQKAPAAQVKDSLAVSAVDSTLTPADSISAAKPGRKKAPAPSDSTGQPAVSPETKSDTIKKPAPADTSQAPPDTTKQVPGTPPPAKSEPVGAPPDTAKQTQSPQPPAAPDSAAAGDSAQAAPQAPQPAQSEPAEDKAPPDSAKAAPQEPQAAPSDSSKPGGGNP